MRRKRFPVDLIQDLEVGEAEVGIEYGLRHFAVDLDVQNLFVEVALSLKKSTWNTNESA